LGDVVAGRWSGFIADGDGAKALHEVGNPDHRVRVEHDRDRLFINLATRMARAGL